MRAYRSVLLLPLLLAGCNLDLSSIPIAKDLTTRATASPFSLGRGSLRGSVVGADGESQPLGRAFVTSGGVSALTADPNEDDAVEEDTVAADQDNAMVMHDFSAEEDGSDVQPAIRIIRKTNVAASEKYVYLKKGEFFLEGLPEGNVTLVASQGTVSSSPNLVTVYKNTIVEDVRLNLFISPPLENLPDGSPPEVIEWAKLDPVNGISVTVEEKVVNDQNSGPLKETNLIYKPDPPDVAITLKAPPGSKGTTITKYIITYEYSTNNQIKAAQPPFAIGPIEVPMAPIQIPPAQTAAPGSPQLFTLPVGSRTLKDIFSGGKDDQPGLVIATIEFRDAAGLPVVGKDLQPLKVSVPLRAL